MSWRRRSAVESPILKCVERDLFMQKLRTNELFTYTWRKREVRKFWAKTYWLFQLINNLNRANFQWKTLGRWPFWDFFGKPLFYEAIRAKTGSSIYLTFRRWTAKDCGPRIPKDSFKWFQRKNGTFMFKKSKRRRHYNLEVKISFQHH